MNERLGFSGSRSGMTPDQGRQLIDILKDYQVLLHGDCQGADEKAHQIAVGLGKRIQIYPPINARWRAWCKGAEFVHPEQEYLERNRRIANACDALAATPAGFNEELRSGTWATVRYARRYGKHIFLIFPDGTIKEETWK